jgi:hypothetical protein
MAAKEQQQLEKLRYEQLCHRQQGQPTHRQHSGFRNVRTIRQPCQKQPFSQFPDRLYRNQLKSQPKQKKQLLKHF